MVRPASNVTPLERRGTNEHFPCFDGLRAIAAIAVLMHHAAIETAFNLRGTLHVPATDWTIEYGKYFTRMDAGVQVFFLISGFLLYRPFVAAAFDERSPMGPRQFFRHRFLRIFPAYWFAYICIAVFIGLDMPVGGARSMLQQFFLVHLYDPTDGGARALGGISQSWTLVVELSFYLFIPLYAYVMRRIDDRAGARRLRVELWGLVALVVISVLWKAGVYWVLPNGGFRNLAQYWLPAQLDLFALGMFLAVIHVWAQRRGKPTPVLETIGRLDWLWWICAFVSFTAVTYWIGLPDILEAVYGFHAFGKQYLYGITAFFLLLPAVFGPMDRGIVRRFLRFAPIAYCGMVSYGIYLWHQGFIKLAHQWGGWARKAGEPELATFRGNFLYHVAIALALSVAAATVSWYLIEKPILRRKDRPLFRTRGSKG